MSLPAPEVPPATVSALHRNRSLLVLDTLLLGAAIGVAALLERLVPPAGVLTLFAAVSVSTKLLVFFSGGLYRRLWRYASVAELKVVVGVSVVASGLGLVIGLLINGVSGAFAIPGTLLAFDALATLIIPLAGRALLRVLEDRRPARTTEELQVLIVGAGSAGQMLAKELIANPRHKMNPIGFVDDDPSKVRKIVIGLPVIGRIESIPAVARDARIARVLVAMPSAPGDVVRKVVGLAQEAGVDVRTMPSLSEFLASPATSTNVREVRIEDLLRRAPVQSDLRAVSQIITDRTILVTGAGGSIGSELCRQIAALDPRSLVILGHGENSIFEIQQELRSTFPELAVSAVIADVRDRARMFETVERHRPYAIFHAAAHKHVPLMEDNVIEAVTNNVVGTQNTVDAALRGGVPHFVLISSDKAVRPTSVMGATKRVAEMIVQNAAVRNERRYVAVRFGNVLGSRGSVVPTFLRQIRAGGPVTVTDPEMRRFFMTIPEAVQLVLQAGSMGVGAEVFLLDMGAPVKVVDLANDLIRLSGLEPGRDIAIEFTGMRPGEKLYEEMFFSNEEASPTTHSKILRARKAGLNEGIPRQVSLLVEAALEGQPPATLRQRLAGLVQDFASPPSPSAPGDTTRRSGPHAPRNSSAGSLPNAG